MRIIAGRAKGRRLRSPPRRKTRPMMDRAKEGIFSALGEVVSDAAVLDLYAGSGSLGLEALSRGARHTVFVESVRASAAVLEHNISTVGLGGRVVVQRVEDYLERPGTQFDLAFVDPPYDLPLPSVEAVLERLARRLSSGATVVVHRRKGSGEVAGPPELTVADRRCYGDAEVTRLMKEALA